MDKRSDWYRDAPLVIAHRGASLFAPENTMAAFELAVEAGAHAIELDVKISQDGEVIVMHDSTLDRTTNGTGAVRNHALKVLKNLDAGAHFSKHFTGEQIPTLAEVFDELGEKLLINVELTNYATPFDKLPEKVVSLVVRRGIESSILLSSFNPIALIKVNKIAPEIQIGLLVLGSSRRIVNRMMRKWLAYDCYNPEWDLVSQDVIEQERRAEHRVYAWTVNAPEDMLRLIRMGVNGIITDDPALAIRALERA